MVSQMDSREKHTEAVKHPSKPVKTLLKAFAKQLRAQEIYQTLWRLAQQEKTPLYLVGGVVRDLFFDQLSPADLDLAVSGETLAFAATYARLIKGRYVLLDAVEQTARVVYRKRMFIDFTRLRGASIEEDLQERDFTINAMALPFAECMTSDVPRLIDPYGGKSDLEQGIIRTVSPRSMITDPLRMVRAYRFAAQFGFTILPETEAEIKKHLSRLQDVSTERIHDEILKLLATNRASALLAQMTRSGLLFTIFPELKRLGESQLSEKAWAVLSNLEAILHNPAAYCDSRAEQIQRYLIDNPHRIPLLKLASLFSSVGEREGAAPQESVALWEAAGERLRFSKADVRFVHLLLRYRTAVQQLLGLEGKALTQEVYALFKEAGPAVIGLLLLVMGKVWTDYSEKEKERFIYFVEQCIDLLDTWIIPTLNRPRLLSGHDLQQIFGLPPGPAFSQILQEAEAAEIRREFRTKAEAVAWVKTRFDLAPLAQR